MPTTKLAKFVYAAKLRCTVVNFGFLVTSLVLAASAPVSLYLLG